MTNTLDQFWAQVDKNTDSDCWLWTGRTDGKGYGFFSYASRAHRAHRLSYRLLVGEIPEGLQLDHLCRVRNCVNPAHLEPVTNRVNVLRGISMVAENAKKTHCPNDHEYTPDNITWTKTYPDGRKSGRRCKKCMRDRWLAKYGKHEPYRAKGTDHPLAKLTPEAVRIIRATPRTRNSVRELADRFGVSIHPIHMVLLGKTWRHVS